MRYGTTTRVVAALALLALSCGGSACAGDIPADSFSKLGVVFGGVRDRLWDANEHYWHHGDFERCIAALRLITEIAPNDTQAFADASWLMWNQGRSGEAEAYLKKGLALNRDTDDIYFNLGFFYYNAGRYADAIDPLETAVVLGSHWRNWHLLAHSYERAGCPAEALSIWLLMEARDPEFIVPQIQIDRILSGEKPSVLRDRDGRPAHSPHD